MGYNRARLLFLSLRCQRLVDDEGCSEEQAVAILNTALERGIRYFDSAWLYSEGLSEERAGLVAKHRREEMWIATKTRDTTRDGARSQLEDSLTRLQTDYIDERRLHNVWGMDWGNPTDWKPRTEPAGLLDW